MLFVRGLILTVLVFLVTEPRVILGEYAGCDNSIQTIDLSHTSNGTIHSPGYPYYNYGNNQNCQWLIKAPSSPMEKVLIYFTAFDLESCCTNCDSVEIFDGSNRYYTRLSRSCGSSLPSPVYSSGRYLYMRFTSDSSLTRQGFVAHYRVLSSLSGCPSIVPGASAGVIYSPNFPSNYPRSKSCEWLITAPLQKMIKLNFTRFNLKSTLVGYCNDYVEVRNRYYSLIGKYCGAQIPSSITSSTFIHVRFHSDSTFVDAGFMAFYQTGYSGFSTTSYPRTRTFPWHWTTKRHIYPTPAASTYACKPHFKTSISVGSSSSSSISSPLGDHYYHTKSPKTTCTFQIDTTTGYILELSFDDMSISSCSSCSCGYVKVRDGSSSSAKLLGIYCNGNYQGTVSSEGNHMFVEYYGYYSGDSFKATVRSKKDTPVNVAAIVVPIVVAVVLFSIIFVVIKCTTIMRSAEPAGSSGVNEVTRQPLSHRIELPPTTQSQSSHATSQSSSHPYSDPFTTVSAPPPPSTDNSQGVTNMSMEDGAAQL